MWFTEELPLNGATNWVLSRIRILAFHRAPVEGSRGFVTNSITTVGLLHEDSTMRMLLHNMSPEYILSSKT